jgi:hypothetical protein
VLDAQWNEDTSKVSSLLNTRVKSDSSKGEKSVFIEIEENKSGRKVDKEKLALLLSRRVSEWSEASQKKNKERYVHFEEELSEEVEKGVVEGPNYIVEETGEVDIRVDNSVIKGSKVVKEKDDKGFNKLGVSSSILKHTASSASAVIQNMANETLIESITRADTIAGLTSHTVGMVLLLVKLLKVVLG